MERDIHENCHKRKAAGARHPKIREKKSEMEIDLKKVLQQSSKVAKKKKNGEICNQGSSDRIRSLLTRNIAFRYWMRESWEKCLYAVHVKRKESARN
jgi:hypothetical protein